MYFICFMSSAHLYTNMCVFKSQCVVGRAGCSQARYDSLQGNIFGHFGGGFLIIFKKFLAARKIIFFLIDNNNSNLFSLKRGRCTRVLCCASQRSSSQLVNN